MHELLVNGLKMYRYIEDGIRIGDPGCVFPNN